MRKQRYNLSYQVPHHVISQGPKINKRIYGPRREKTCLWLFANNKGADQPAHPRSLISAFIIHLLESIISRLATSRISIFKLVSVAEQAGLSLALSETPKTGFLVTRPIFEIRNKQTIKVRKRTKVSKTALCDNNNKYLHINVCTIHPCYSCY